MITLKLKLYKPSKYKRNILDKAMLDYSRAFQYLLDKAHGEIEQIEKNFSYNGNYNTYSILKWIDKDISKELNRFSVEPFKDSLKIDFASTIAGYLNLKNSGKHVNYPSAYIPNDIFEKEYEKLMEDIVQGEKTAELSLKKIEKLIYKNSTLRPILFARYAKNRNYCLLYDEDADRFFAKIYLMNAKNEMRKKSNATDGRVLKYVYKGFEVMKKSTRKESYLIFPLSFGRWQEEYLKQALENPGIIKGARLIKEKDEYFLSIAIDEIVPERLETKTYMGISRGIRNAVCFSIVDESGNEIESGVFCKDLIYNIANSVVEKALNKKCQVIMQKNLQRGDGLKWSDGKNEMLPLMKNSDYSNLYRILKYKLKRRGLPSPIRVSCKGVYYTCPICHLTSYKNRTSDELFICLACGNADKIEHIGSINTAKKLIKYKNDKICIKVEKKDGKIRFINEDLGLDFCPENPYDCIDEFKEELKLIIRQFYNTALVKDAGFKKKYSLIKKLESSENLIDAVQIIK